MCDTAPMTEPGPRDIVTSYVERVWNLGDRSAVVEYCADPYVRHDAGRSRVMSHADQVERVTSERAAGTAADGRSLHFETLLLAGDGQDVTWVWNMTGPTGTELAESGVTAEVVGEELRICGIEVFRVAEGRIARSGTARRWRVTGASGGDPAVGGHPGQGQNAAPWAACSKS